MKIIILCVLLLHSCGYFQEKPANVFYVRETTTSHCFKVWGPEHDRNFMWIDCHKLPKRGRVYDVQDFDTDGMTEWEEE